jgi:hypothetical protein
MALEQFTAAALATIDGGRLREALDLELRRCQVDCADRPALEKARKITLSIDLTPVQADDGADLDSIDVQFAVDSKLPRKRSKAYNMRAAEGTLLFNELSPEEVHQGTLDLPTGPQGAVSS